MNEQQRQMMVAQMTGFNFVTAYGVEIVAEEKTVLQEALGDLFLDFEVNLLAEWDTHYREIKLFMALQAARFFLDDYLPELGVHGLSIGHTEAGEFKPIADHQKFEWLSRVARWLLRYMGEEESNMDGPIGLLTGYYVLVWKVLHNVQYYPCRRISFTDFLEEYNGEGETGFNFHFN